MKAVLDKRLRELEHNSITRIDTLADWVVWLADPSRDPDPVFSPVMQDCLERLRSRKEQ